jgi:nucleotide-binding universal stress UspA family protein
MEGTMAPLAIISYDDTPNDQDALVLGHLLADAGTRLTLAYVRHTTEVEHTHEEREEHAAEALLERGARWLEDCIGVERKVVVSPCTADGLRWLAAQQQADVIVFGSDYRTAAGHVAPGRSAQTLLEGGAAALAIAPAAFRERRGVQIDTIGLLADADDQAALVTAQHLAEAHDAMIVRDDPRVDLLIIGSRAEARPGHVMITSRAANVIEEATCPVLILARGVAVEFGSLVTY